MRFFLVMLLLAIPASALTVDGIVLGTEADATRCTVSGRTDRFQETQDQVYARFVVRHIRRGDRLTIEWVGPAGQVHTSSTYDSLPVSRSLCFVNGLPVGGFSAAQHPGSWTIRVAVNQRVAAQRKFEITGTIDPLAPRISQLNRDDSDDQQTHVEILGERFVPESVVNVAQYTASGGWNYIAMVLPQGASAERLDVQLAPLQPAEYLVIVRNPDGRQSAPVRFLVSTRGGYKLPIPAGSPWMITQRPYGGFSHYGRSRHAWDIAPTTGACLVAMRGGTAYTFDLGWRQTPHRRIFGNYITVAHDDGEYSHYAHLQTGTFRVGNGQRVEQGQPLAIAGNSGYTVGQGGGRHVHVHVTRAFPISSPSVPFEFDDLAQGEVQGSPMAVVSSNNAAKGDCSRAGRGHSFTGSVAVTEVWTQTLSVRAGSTDMHITLDYQGDGLDLSLISPDGRQHALYADPTGFGSVGREFRLRNPAPGPWLVCIRGMKGGGERVTFRVVAIL